MPVGTPNQSPWSFSSTALLDTSVTDGDSARQLLATLVRSTDDWARDSEQEQPVTSVPPTEVTADESAGQIPVQILQVAAFLQAFLDLASEGNAALIEEIRRTRPGTLRDLRTEAMDPQVLSNLFVDFGIMAERLAQQHAANHPIENVEDDSS